MLNYTNCLKVDISKNNTHIYNSYIINNWRTIRYILEYYRDKSPEDYAINKRSLFSMINEWRAHNLLYKLHYKRNRTKDVDLDINEKWYRKIGYFILSVLLF